jgi:hypothetical protein
MYINQPSTAYSILVEQDGQPAFDEGPYSSQAHAEVMFSYFKGAYSDARVPSAARLVLYACHLSWPPWATPPWRSSVGDFAQIPHSLQVRAELQGAPAAP